MQNVAENPLTESAFVPLAKRTICNFCDTFIAWRSASPERRDGLWLGLQAMREHTWTKGDGNFWRRPFGIEWMIIDTDYREPVMKSFLQEGFYDFFLKMGWILICQSGRVNLFHFAGVSQWITFEFGGLFGCVVYGFVRVRLLPPFFTSCPSPTKGLLVGLAWADSA